MITWPCDDIYGNHDNGFPGILGRPMCLWPPPLTAMGFPTVREAGFPRGGQVTRRQTSGSGSHQQALGPSDWESWIVDTHCAARGKRCAKVAQNVRGGFQCHRVQIGFLDFCPAVRRLVLLVPLPLWLMVNQRLIVNQRPLCIVSVMSARCFVRQSLTTKLDHFAIWLALVLILQVGLPRVLSRKIRWKSIIRSG